VRLRHVWLQAQRIAQVGLGGIEAAGVQVQLAAVVEHRRIDAPARGPLQQREGDVLLAEHAQQRREVRLGAGMPCRQTQAACGHLAHRAGTVEVGQALAQLHEFGRRGRRQGRGDARRGVGIAIAPRAQQQRRQAEMQREAATAGSHGCLRKRERGRLVAGAAQAVHALEQGVAVAIVGRHAAIVAGRPPRKKKAATRRWPLKCYVLREAELLTSRTGP
jgi:hypothetical protein